VGATRCPRWQLAQRRGAPLAAAPPPLSFSAASLRLASAPSGSPRHLPQCRRGLVEVLPSKCASHVMNNEKALPMKSLWPPSFHVTERPPTGGEQEGAELRRLQGFMNSSLMRSSSLALLSRCHPTLAHLVIAGPASHGAVPEPRPEGGLCCGSSLLQGDTRPAGKSFTAAKAMSGGALSVGGALHAKEDGAGGDEAAEGHEDETRPRNSS